MMPDLLIICRDALSNSLLGSVATAILSKQQENLDVGLLFMQEAAIALAEKKFSLSPLLVPYAEKIKKVHADFNFPEDPAELVRMAHEAGVRVMTCPVWSQMMGLEKDFPPEVEIIAVEELMRLIAGSGKILGSF